MQRNQNRNPVIRCFVATEMNERKLFTKTVKIVLLMPSLLKSS